MEALSPIGSVAVTHQTKKLCEGYFTFKPLGAARIRGVSEAVKVYEVTRLGPLAHTLSGFSKAWPFEIRRAAGRV
jgi:class 3 adenylate cyclase